MGTDVTLRDGTRAVTWSVLPEDRAEISRGYDALSPGSKFHRFLAAVPHLTDALLTHLVDEVDGVDHVALVLFVFDEPTVGTPAGIGRIVRYADDPAAADVAITVAEEFRGRGVATALLQSLLLQRPEGVHRIETVVAADNDPSLAMLRRLGTTTVVPQEPGDLLDVTVELAGAAPGAVPTAPGAEGP